MVNFRNKIKIIYMNDEPHYSGKESIDEHIDEFEIVEVN